MEVASILLSARHKTPDSTVTYLDDSGTLEVHVLQDPVNNKRHRVGRLDPIHIIALPSFASLLLESQKYQKPLLALSEWFVDKICDGNAKEFSISRISLEEELKAKLFERLSSEEAEQFWQMHTQCE
jgi:hypothetical protein